MGKLVIVANRLPIKINVNKEGLDYQFSEGGLASGLRSLSQTDEMLWIGWPGVSKSEVGNKTEEVRSYLSENNMQPIFLTKKDVRNYYEGFSNETIWPLFHYFIENARYETEFWKTYYKVNKAFCREVLKHLEPDDTIWVHDYHLMLLPLMLRKEIPEATIGYFLHIPFPSSEVYRLLPWREELLNGLLGADLIGFHTSNYMRHFSSSVYRLLGIESYLGRFQVDPNRFVQVDAFPMGIDFNKFHEGSQNDEIKEEAKVYRSKFGNRSLVLSMDRLDYSKGILQRLKAFDTLLERRPAFESKISLILVVVPSRGGVDEYQQLKEEIDEMVGYINGKYGGLDWLPVHYFYRSLSFPSLVSLYSIADIALVTPFRDGMNLIAKEFIASKTNQKGVLILSEMAGSSSELSEAIIINPNDIIQMAKALEQAIDMPEKEQIRRIDLMQKKLKRYNIEHWANDFIGKLQNSKTFQKGLDEKYLSKEEATKIKTHYQRSNRRLIILDYDGTLVRFTETPQKAKPDKAIIKLIKRLTENPANQVILTSGRDRKTMQNWFGHLKLGMISEHGAWIKDPEGEWYSEESGDTDWKKRIHPILNEYTIKTPGSFVEEKDFSLVWHYRQSDAWLSEIRTRNLSDSLASATSNMDLQVIEGDKLIEVKNLGINKGKALKKWIDMDWGFILAIGNDWTDEYAFKVIPEHGYTIKLGFRETSVAKYNLKYPEEVRALLENLLSRK